MPRALQISGMAVPLANSASASRSLRMICSGEWRMRFIGSPPALSGENDSHIGWASLRGAGQVGQAAGAEQVQERAVAGLVGAQQASHHRTGALADGVRCNRAGLRL